MQKRPCRLERLEKIISTQSLIMQADLDLDTFMQLVVDTLQDLTSAKGCVVESVDSDYMVYRSASGSIAQHVGLRLLRANSLSGLCVQTGQVLRCDDAEADPRVDAAACRKVGVLSMICTPLFETGVPIGVLKVMSERSYAFDEEDVESLALLATALGAALGKQVAFKTMQRIQRALQDSEDRLRAILEHANDAVISVDDAGSVTQWNKTAEKLFGWTAGEVIGCRVVDLIVPPPMRDGFQVGVQRFLKSSEWSEMNMRRESVAVDRAGKELAIEVSLSVSNHPEGLEFTAFIHDISERKRMEGVLREMALSDGLTGLANRRHFMAALSHATVRAQRQDIGLALFYMDMNGFKLINDVHGHEVGDSVLKEFARRVLACVRKSDVVARLGGDEFTVLAEGVHTVEQATALAQKIVDALALPLPGTTIMFATSIGISRYSPSAEPEQLLLEADTAMYIAKEMRAAGSAISIYRHPVNSTP